MIRMQFPFPHMGTGGGGGTTRIFGLFPAAFALGALLLLCLATLREPFLPPFSAHLPLASTFPSFLEKGNPEPWVVNITYHPSIFERDWARIVAQLGGVSNLLVCPLLAESEHKGKVERVLRILDAQNEEEAGRAPLGTTERALDAEEAKAGEGALLSHMEYALSDGNVVRVRMEPLVGLLRDPRQSCPEGSRSHWLPPVADMMHGDMRQWLLLDGRRQALHKEQKAVLLDMGASTWGHTGARWLSNRLMQHGMVFEHIWSFEAQQRPVTDFLKGASLADMARIHYYNVPVGGEIDPWAFLKSTVKPNDFVSVKLDIDAKDIEISLAYQLLKDPELLALVDEVRTDSFSCPA